MRSTNLETFLRERYEREASYFQVYDSYRPDYKKASLTRKFYSKYERPNFDLADPELVKQIKKYKDQGPREKHEWPETENQWYGWFTTPLVPVDWDDSRFYAPRKTTPMMRHEMKMKMDKSSQRATKNLGVPFKLY